jgi:hypothetical protein
MKCDYYQVSIESTDVWNTNFKYKEGLFEWSFMPFGLTDAPVTFMKMMDDILQPFIKYVLVVYLDEILIFTQTRVDHLQHIQQVLITLQQQKLYVNLEKCSFDM